jgi:hypothetical protein
MNERKEKVTSIGQRKVGVGKPCFITFPQERS